MLPPLEECNPPPAAASASPTDVGRMIREWIAKAQRDEPPASGAEEKQLERLKHPFGALEVGGCTLQVLVQLTQFQKLRFVFLHFYPNKKKEAGFVYFEAATGVLHGLHLAPEQRGQGLSKPLVLYYVLFGRRFGLETRETAHNRKPLFAKLYTELGYSPQCTDFPFLLLRRPPADAPHQQQQQQPHDQEPASYVLPLSAQNPRRQPQQAAETKAAARVPLDDADRHALKQLRLDEAPETLAALQKAWKLRFTAVHPDKGGSAEEAQAVTAARDALHRKLFPKEQIDTSWTFTQRLAKSQDIVVVSDAQARLAEPGAIHGTTMLYAKTTWSLPDNEAMHRRDAILGALRGVRCWVYVVVAAEAGAEAAAEAAAAEAASGAREVEPAADDLHWQRRSRNWHPLDIASMAPSTAEVEPEGRVVTCLLDLPDDALDALAERLAARSYARFALACRACAAATARVVSVVVPATVAQRLRSNRCAGQLACAKCPVMELPAGVFMTIGEDAFRDCDALRSIYIPPGVEAVHRAAFADCTSLSSVHLPPSVTFIGSHAFNCCKALTSIAIPVGNECIDSYTFASCSALTTVTLPETVYCIEEGAFENCRALASINIPEDIEEIDESAFDNCDSLDDATREIIKDAIEPEDDVDESGADEE